MKAHFGNRDDGIIGLGVLALMTIALIAGQAHSAGESASSPAMGSTLAAPLLENYNSVSPPQIGGAIRELRIMPAFINEAAALDWSSDEELLDTVRKTGF